MDKILVNHMQSLLLMIIIVNDDIGNDAIADFDDKPQNMLGMMMTLLMVTWMRNLSTCSAEITGILLNSLSFKGISRPPCNLIIVVIMICIDVMLC